MQSRAIIICVAIISLIAGAAGQSKQGSPQTSSSKKTTQPAPQARPDDESQREQDAIKLDTTLVTVPVIASDRNGLYIPDLQKEDFAVYEDGVKQEIVFFATVKEPFHVVLMLDTSASTQDQLRQIQKAARAFIEQLQPADRVKVIAFADTVQDLIDFTNDQAALRAAIENVQSGKGTRLYDAVQRGLAALRPVTGRKAIVIFTDGVDMKSEKANYGDNLQAIEESGVIVYPIRYDTRTTVEALVRGQASQGVTDPSVVLGGPPTGTTPTTVPGDTRVPEGRVPEVSLPSVILDRFPKDPRIPDTRHPDIGGSRTRYPNDPRYPDSRYPDDPRYPDSRYPDDPRYPNDSPLPTRRFPNDPTSRRPAPRDEDATSVWLDGLYRIADQYLDDLATKSGGKLHRADTLHSLPLAFEAIAAELRTQYSLGYYPTNAARDGGYRKIQVRAARKDVVVRARPGYRAPSGS